MIMLTRLWHHILLILLLFGPAAYGQDPAIDRLARQLDSPDTGIRRQAAIGLGRASSAQSVRLLDSAMGRENDVSIRLELVRALRQIAFQRYPGYRQALLALGRAADANVESDIHVRLKATQALWEAAKKDLLNPLTFLARNLKDPHMRLRLEAVAMLRRWGNPAVVAPLGRAAMDKNQPAEIRLRCIAGLGAVALSEGGPAGRAIHRANIEANSHFGAGPITPISTLEKRHQGQIRYLSAVAEDPDNSHTLALRAVKSIGQVKDKSALPALRRIAENHGSPAVRRQATRVLSHVLARQYE
jgi:HEAT repeat protein